MIFNVSKRVVRTTAIVLGGSLGAATAVAMGIPAAELDVPRCATPHGVVRGPTGSEPLVALDRAEIVDPSALWQGNTDGRGQALEGVVRHASADPLFGVAYVDDREGGDALVIEAGDGTSVLLQDDEVLHPSWSPSGDLVWSTGTELRLLDRSTRSTVGLSAPQGTVSVAYPVFVGTSSLVAVAEEPIRRVSAEFESLNNLWRLDLRSRTWQQVTSFRATRDRWSVIRTPIVDAAGDVLFVRVQGEASRTRGPRFELWKLRGDRASLVRSLGAEMYLAGTLDGAIVWNVADARGRWHLLKEASQGRLRDLGCGRVAVDPLTQSDPDLGPVGPTGRTTDPPTASPTPPPTVSTTPELVSGLGILVGDFATHEEAEMMAGVIALRMGVTPTVIDASTQPTLIRPGVYAAVITLPPQADPESELRRFRELLPETRNMSWIVALT